MIKINRKGRPQERVFLVTDVAVYNLAGGAGGIGGIGGIGGGRGERVLKRRITVDAIAALTGKPVRSAQLQR